MNLPNQLTVSRFVLTGAFLGAIFTGFPYNETIALVFFVLASITDWLDGVLARKYQLITNFGILMDPLADKILTCSAFIAFVGSSYLPAWIAVIIVARELAITGLRLLAASKNLVLAAERFGKHTSRPRDSERTEPSGSLARRFPSQQSRQTPPQKQAVCVFELDHEVHPKFLLLHLPHKSQRQSQTPPKDFPQA